VSGLSTEKWILKSMEVGELLEDKDYVMVVF